MARYRVGEYSECTRYSKSYFLWSVAESEIGQFLLSLLVWIVLYLLHVLSTGSKSHESNVPVNSGSRLHLTLITSHKNRLHDGRPQIIPRPQIKQNGRNQDEMNLLLAIICWPCRTEDRGVDVTPCLPFRPSRWFFLIVFILCVYYNIHSNYDEITCSQTAKKIKKPNVLKPKCDVYMLKKQLLFRPISMTFLRHIYTKDHDVIAI